MKTLLSSLNQVLTFHLEVMYNAEKQIQKELPELVLDLHSPQAVDIVSRYTESANDKRLKLKRIFSYLLAGPFERGSGALGLITSECSDILDITVRGRYRDVLIVSSLEGITEYKATSYNTALKIALQLNLKKVAELLEEIISWEVESAQNMSDFISRELVESDTFVSSPSIL